MNSNLTPITKFENVFSADCPYQVDDTQVSIVAGAVDPIMEFDGRENSHVEVNPPAVSGPFYVEVWARRVPELRSHDGRILDLVPLRLNDPNDPGYGTSLFRWFETFNTMTRGVLIQYVGGGDPVAFYDLDG